MILLSAYFIHVCERSWCTSWSYSTVSPPWHPGKYLVSKSLKEWQASSPQHTEFGKALESSVWRTHLFPQVLCQIFWEPYLFTITSFTIPRNTFLVHYTILEGFFPSLKEIWLSTLQRGLGRGNLRAGKEMDLCLIKKGVSHPGFSRPVRILGLPAWWTLHPEC